MAGSLATNPSFTTLLFQRRSVLIAAMAFLAIVALCILAPLIAPADPARMAVRARLTPPSEAYWLGADAYGRDVLSRLLNAGQTSLQIGLGVASCPP